MRDITKTFPGVKALSNVNLSVEEGEIHAIVGENGAGKSTLMKVLSGVYPSGTYDGQIIFHGQECHFKGIHDSEHIGIVIIHQELALSPYLSIAENIFLNNEVKGALGLIDWNKTNSEASKLLARVGLKENPMTKIRDSGVGKQQLVALVHSGSRGLGETVLRAQVDQHFGTGVEADSFAAEEYLSGHDFAALWAKANRELIARRFVAALGAEAECVWDGCHNSITRRETEGGVEWLHRKGAVEAESDFVVIPGSRGSLSYVVKPIGDGESHAWSLAHGSGRKRARSDARQRMRERFSVAELAQTRLGGRVICEQRDLLYEEAPAAYKKIEAVVQDLVDAGLVSVIATLRPLLTYKTRKVRR